MTATTRHPSQIGPCIHGCGRSASTGSAQKGSCSECYAEQQRAAAIELCRSQGHERDERRGANGRVTCRRCDALRQQRNRQDAEKSEAIRQRDRLRKRKAKA